MEKIALDSNLFAKKVAAKEIFGSNLFLGEKTVRPAEGETPNSLGKMGVEISGTRFARPTLWGLLYLFLQNWSRLSYLNRRPHPSLTPSFSDTP